MATSNSQLPKAKALPTPNLQGRPEARQGMDLGVGGWECPGLWELVFGTCQSFHNPDCAALTAAMARSPRGAGVAGSG